jgi:hypothetical protein
MIVLDSVLIYREVVISSQTTQFLRHRTPAPLASSSTKHAFINTLSNQTLSSFTLALENKLLEEV